MGPLAPSAPTRLTSSGPTDLLIARQRRDTLLMLARSLASAPGVVPHAATRCPSHSCHLAEVADAPLCELVHRLAGVEVGNRIVVDVDGGVAAFRQAVVGALEAVRLCRQIAHRLGTCWFTSAADDRGCGDVLRLAHRLA